MPAATTTMSHSSSGWSSSQTPRTLSSPMIAVVRALVCTSMPSALDALAQDVAAGRADLGVHQVRAGVHHVDLQAVGLQPAGGLQAEQAAADHHRPAVVVVLGVVDHPAGVVDRAEREDAGQQLAVVGAQALDRRHERAAAGGDDQHVVRGDLSVIAVDQLGEPVDPGGPHAGVQGDVVLDVPGQAVEEDVGVGLLAGQHVGEHDPVVVAVRLVAEHGDGELFRAAAGQDLLDRAGAGHAVADHHQPAAGVAVAGVRTSSSNSAIGSVAVVRRPR